MKYQNLESLKTIIGVMKIRTYVGEDVNPQPNPNIPQQDTAATAAADDITWNLDDQLPIQGNGVESRDLWDAVVPQDSRETEDLGRSWEELMGNTQDWIESAGLGE